jgi:hypothetical protein
MGDTLDTSQSATLFLASIGSHPEEEKRSDYGQGHERPAEAEVGGIARTSLVGVVEGLPSPAP